MNTHYLKKFRKKANLLLCIEEDCGYDGKYKILFKETGCCSSRGLKTMEDALKKLNDEKRFYIHLLCLRERAIREHSIFK